MTPCCRGGGARDVKYHWGDAFAAWALCALTWQRGVLSGLQGSHGLSQRVFLGLVPECLPGPAQ